MSPINNRLPIIDIQNHPLINPGNPRLIDVHNLTRDAVELLTRNGIERIEKNIQQLDSLEVIIQAIQEDNSQFENLALRQELLRCSQENMDWNPDLRDILEALSRETDMEQTVGSHKLFYNRNQLFQNALKLLKQEKEDQN